MTEKITKDDIIKDFDFVINELYKEGYCFDKFVASKGADDCELSFEFIKA